MTSKQIQEIRKNLKKGIAAATRQAKAFNKQLERLQAVCKHVNKRTVTGAKYLLDCKDCGKVWATTK